MSFHKSIRVESSCSSVSPTVEPENWHFKFYSLFSNFYLPPRISFQMLFGMSSACIFFWTCKIDILNSIHYFRIFTFHHWEMFSFKTVVETVVETMETRPVHLNKAINFFIIFFIRKKPPLCWMNNRSHIYIN